MRTLVVVTGGSAGLGRAVLATAPGGARLVDVSRTGCDLPDVVHLAADLADPATWSDLARALRRIVRAERWARVVVVHAAGTLDPIGFAGEVDADAYARNVLLNSASSQVVGHLALGALTSGEVASVPRDLVLLSSGAAESPYPGWSSYGAAKAAIDQWVRTVGQEQRRRGGVRVLAVTPGVVATGMQELIRSTDEHDFPAVGRFRDLHAQGQLRDPEDAARALWDLLEDPDVTTGEVLDLRHR